ncbi:MAG TPA: methionyl-tRNA formyltransferase [Thermoanaerobaculia bacterium]|nr:methionyl-tRNA formyltransferase [Thermoanaerobaculia bacterium]
MRLSRLVFFGTPEFALPTLQALCAAGRAPLLVVARPDRPAGRGQRQRTPPVAAWARQQGLEVAQPASVRDAELQQRLGALAPDLAVVVAFGQIFPRELLALPRHGCVNVHASLLPRHRGAAPVQAALRAGDERTGVTTMVMEEGLDSGPILLAAETELSGRETAGELAPRLAHLGAAALLETVDRLQAGTVAPRPQEDAEATYAPRLRKEDGRVDWARTARQLFDQLRAVTPWPGLHAELRGEPLRIHWAEVVEGGEGVAGGESPPGALLGLADGRLRVACGDGTVLGLERLQRPGRRPVDAPDFANGERLAAGERLA